MQPHRLLRALTKGTIRLLLLAPIVAVLVAVLVDRGPSGRARWSLFPLALVALDPFAWTCFRNSLIFAAVNSLAALILGVALGWLLARRPSRRRASYLSAAASSTAAPACLALGLIGLFGTPDRWPWPFSASSPALGGVGLESWRGLPLWVAWFWTTFPGCVALVTVATVAAIERLEPSWIEAARLAGAGPVRAWRNVNWPLIRPSAARAAALVFSISLMEPGAPLILGLRRTIAFQVVDSARRSDPFPRLAIWAGMAGLVGLAGRLLFTRWGGPRISADRPEGRQVTERRPRIASGSYRGGIFSLLLSGMLLIPASLPILGLLRLSTGEPWLDSLSVKHLMRGVSTIGLRLSEPPVPQLAFNSVILGLEVAPALMILAWLLATNSRAVPVRTHDLGLERRLAHTPALVLGVGVLSVSWLTGLASSSMVGQGNSVRLSAALARFSMLSGIDEIPWIPLTFAVGLSLVAMVLGRLPRSTASRDRASTAAFDAARVAGASRSRARAMSVVSQHRRRLGYFIVVWALAATNLSPALLFTPWTDGKTAAPGIVDLANGPGDSQAQAAALALCVLAINASALAVARLTSALPEAEP